MSTDTQRAPRAGRRILAVIAGLVVVGLIGGLVFVLLPRAEENTLVVDFDRTVSLYEGSHVRILGVDVGEVSDISPRGSSVRATITWDAQYDLPADVSAVIVSPSVVGDRFVQLTPAYSGSGPTLDDGAFLDQTRTAVPTELDEAVAALDSIATALGPEGANADGDLSRLLKTSAENLDGKGAELRRSIDALAKLSTTADGSKEELFGSVEKIETLVSALEQNDDAVRDFNTNLASVSDVLSGEKDDLQAALRTLAATLSNVQVYVKDNRKSLRRNVDGLTEVTESLAKQRKNLAAMLEDGPDALANLATTYDPSNGTIDARATVLDKLTNGTWTQFTQGSFLAAGFCSAPLRQGGAEAQTCTDLASLLDAMADQVPAAGGSTPAALAGDEDGAGEAGDGDTADAAGGSDEEDGEDDPDAGLADLMGVA